MRTLSRVFLLVLFMTFSLVSRGQLLNVDYLVVKPENEEEYLAVEKKWKKVHQERLKVGLILGWYLYKVRYAGTESPYQYVTINIYKNFDDSENEFFEGVFEKALKGENISDLNKATLHARDLANTEVFVWVDGLERRYNNPAKYLYINFIDVKQGEENNYLDMERYVWKPIHSELQKTSKMASWSLWDLWFYSHTKYNFVTFNEFYEFSDIDSYNYSEVFQKVHQGKDLTAFMRNTAEARKSEKTELWELVDFVGAE